MIVGVVRIHILVKTAFCVRFLFHLQFSYDLFHIFPVLVYLVSLVAYVYCKF